jgi:hypothetical protein
MRLENCESLTKIDLSNCAALCDITVSGCDSSEIIFPAEGKNLKSISIRGCAVGDRLDFGQYASLEKVKIANCSAKMIDMSKCVILRDIHVSECPNMEAISLPDTGDSLEFMVINGTQIRTVDVSRFSHLGKIDLQGNGELESIILPPYNQNRLKGIDLKGCNKITDGCRAEIESFHKKVTIFRDIADTLAKERRKLLWEYCPAGVDDSGRLLEVRPTESYDKAREHLKDAIASGDKEEIEKKKTNLAKTRWGNIVTKTKENGGLPVSLLRLEEELNSYRASAKARSKMDDALARAERDIPGITKEFDETLAAWKRKIDAAAPGRIRELEDCVARWESSGANFPERIAMPTEEEETRLSAALDELWQSSTLADRKSVV